MDVDVLRNTLLRLFRGPSRKVNPEDLRSVFISYSREDATIVPRLTKLLQDVGVSKVLKDRVSLTIDEQLLPEVKVHIRESFAFIIVISHASAMSVWADQEVQFARELGKPILPIRIDDSRAPAFFAGMQVFDLSQGESDIRDFFLGRKTGYRSQAAIEVATTSASHEESPSRRDTAMRIVAFVASVCLTLVPAVRFLGAYHYGTILLSPHLLIAFTAGIIGMRLAIKWRTSEWNCR